MKKLMILGLVLFGAHARANDTPQNDTNTMKQSSVYNVVEMDIRLQGELTEEMRQDLVKMIMKLKLPESVCGVEDIGGLRRKDDLVRAGIILHPNDTEVFAQLIEAKKGFTMSHEQVMSKNDIQHAWVVKKRAEKDDDDLF